MDFNTVLPIVPACAVSDSTKNSDKPFNRLSDETIGKILKFLDKHSLSCLSLVDRRFFILTSSYGPAFKLHTRVQAILRGLDTRFLQGTRFQNLYVPRPAINIAGALHVPHLSDMRVQCFGSQPPVLKSVQRFLVDCTSDYTLTQCAATQESLQTHEMSELSRLGCYPYRRKMAEITMGLMCGTNGVDRDVFGITVRELYTQALEQLIPEDPDAALLLCNRKSNVFLELSMLPKIARSRLLNNGFRGFTAWLSQMLNIPEELLGAKAHLYLVDAVNVLRQEGEIGRCISLLQEIKLIAGYQDQPAYCAGKILRCKCPAEINIGDLIALDQLRQVEVRNGISVNPTFEVGCILASEKTRHAALSDPRISLASRQCLQRNQPSEIAIMIARLYRLSNQLNDRGFGDEFFLCQQNPVFKEAMVELVKIDLKTAARLASRQNEVNNVFFLSAFSKRLREVYRIDQTSDIDWFKHSLYPHSLEEVRQVADYVARTYEMITPSLNDQTINESWAQVVGWTVYGLLKTDRETAIQMCRYAGEWSDYLFFDIIEYYSRAGDLLFLQSQEDEVLNRPLNSAPLTEMSLAYAQMGHFEHSKRFIPLIKDDCPETQTCLRDGLRRSIALVMCVHRAHTSCREMIAEIRDSKCQEDTAYLMGLILIASDCFEESELTISICRNPEILEQRYTRGFIIATCQQNIRLANRLFPLIAAENREGFRTLLRITQIKAFVSGKDFVAADRLSHEIYREIPVEARDRALSAEQATASQQAYYIESLGIIAAGYLRLAGECLKEGDVLSSSMHRARAADTISRMNPEWDGGDERMYLYNDLVMAYLNANDGDSALAALDLFEPIRFNISLGRIVNQLSDYFSNRGDVKSTLRCLLVMRQFIEQVPDELDKTYWRDQYHLILEHLIKRCFRMKETQAVDAVTNLLQHLLLHTVTHPGASTELLKDVCQTFGRVLQLTLPDFDHEAYVLVLRSDKVFASTILSWISRANPSNGLYPTTTIDMIADWILAQVTRT